MDMKTQIRQALARGYCTPENAGKELDAFLVEAMTKEVLASFQPVKTGGMRPTNHFRWKQLNGNKFNINTQQALRIGDSFLYQILEQWWENEEFAGGEWRKINIAPPD